MTALAKRVVACKGWRWMKRMRMVGGETILSVTLHDGSWWAALGDHPELDGFETYWQPTLPDLDDPATLGCFEHGVLPSAGYNEAHLTAWVDNDGRTMWGVVYRPDPVSFPGTWLSAVEDGSPTKAEALVAALESAP